MSKRRAERARCMLGLQIEQGGVVTPAQLAQGAGYHDWLAASQSYGTFAGRIGRALDLENEGVEWWNLIAIMHCADSKMRGEDFHWTMHPEFRAALKRFSPTDDL